MSSAKKITEHKRNRNRFIEDITPTLHLQNWFNGCLRIERSNTSDGVIPKKRVEDGIICNKAKIYLMSEYCPYFTLKEECIFGDNGNYYLERYNFIKMPRNYCVYCEKYRKCIKSHNKTKTHEASVAVFIDKLAVISNLNTEITRYIYSFIPKYVSIQ